MKRIMTSESTVSTAEDEGEGGASSSTLEEEEEEDETLIMTTVPSSLSSSTTATTTRKRVTFSTIEVREYGMTVGDNPSVSGGIPVTISWEAQLSLTFDLNQFESVRQDARDIRFMRIPHQKRESIARNSGYTSNEIVAVLTEMEQIQVSRQNSAKNCCVVPPPSSTTTTTTTKQSSSKFNLRNIFGIGGAGGGSRRNNTDHNHQKQYFKFGYVLQPEDYAMLNVPDMTKVPISVCVCGLKEIALTTETGTTCSFSSGRDCGDNMSISDCSGGSSSRCGHRRHCSRRRSDPTTATTMIRNTEELTPSDPEFFAGQIILL